MIGMDAHSGRWLSGKAHLVQSVGDILQTAIGLRIKRRSYGSELPDLIDQPMNGANRLRIFAATAYALMTWEPRITLTALQLQVAADGSATMLMNAVAAGSELQVSVPVRAA